MKTKTVLFLILFFCLICCGCGKGKTDSGEASSSSEPAPESSQISEKQEANAASDMFSDIEEGITIPNNSESGIVSTEETAESQQAEKHISESNTEVQPDNSGSSSAGDWTKYY